MVHQEPLCASVRRHCAAVAASARWVTVDLEAISEVDGVAGLDPELHFLEGSTEEVARYVLVLDAINFGSGWFHTLELPPGETGTDAISRALTDHARERGRTWTAEELRRMDSAAIAALLGQRPDHELMRLYAEALNQLGAWLGERTALEAIAVAGASAERLAEQLVAGMPFFDDPGYYKRAQITANDLALSGVASFDDLDVLTIFADNVVPHVLRQDGVLTYAPELAAVIDSGELLPAGSRMEQEIRACAVHACEQLAKRFDVPPRTLDNRLWNRGQRRPYSDRLPHRTQTIFY